MAAPARSAAYQGLSVASTDVPADGTHVTIAPGVHWLRMPLPFALNHINLWILDDAAGPVIVDTGVNGRKTQARWQQVLSAFLPERPSRLLVTHMHPDHAGSAGWLCEEYGLRLAMTRTEYLTCRLLSADVAPPPPAAIEFFRSAGLNDEQLAYYTQVFGGFGKACGPLPPTYDRLQDGQQFSFNGSMWEVIVGNGHSPEHACLWNRELNVIISGDQILPTISSNVSVWPTEPEANPLADWLDSCRRLRARLPEDILVLPSHGKPFVGAHTRLTALIDEHEANLEQLLEYCREPRRVIDVFPVLFRSRINDGNMSLATGESIAHLNYLRHKGLVGMHEDDAGIRWYETQ